MRKKLWRIENMTDPQDLPEENGIVSFFDRSSFFTVLLLLLTLGTGIFVIVAPRPVNELELKEGQIAPVSQFADIRFQIEDYKQTKDLAEKLAAGEPDYYKIDNSLTEQILRQYQDLFAAAKKREDMEKIGETYKPSGKIPAMVGKLNKSSLNFLLSIADNPDWKNKLQEHLDRFLREGIIDKTLQRGLHRDTVIKINDPQNRRHRINAEKLITQNYAAEQLANEILYSYQAQDKELIRRNFIQCMTAVLGSGNLIYDEAFTKARKDEIRESTLNDETKKIYKTYLPGELLLKKGKKVTADDLKLLASYREKKPQNPGSWEFFRRVFEHMLLCLALILTMGLYLFHVRPDFAASNRLLWQLGLITIAAVLLNRGFGDLYLWLSENSSLPRQELLCFAIPIGFVSVLISVIFGVRTAFFAGLFVSAVAALSSMGNQFQLFSCGILINAGGALAVKNVQNYRSFFVRSFLVVSLTSLAVEVIFSLKNLNFENWGLIPWLLMFPFASGLITAVMAQVGVYLLELCFDVNTSMSLQSFYDFNHPLLKELQLKAPGTYHHCLMVSTLAEKAAEEAGLDPIKARVCGMFHDVGKLVQPEYFVENSRGQDMHKDLDPKMSAIIIRSHVAKHGPALARKYKLKRLLYNTITQHHGNDIIAFFYKKEQTQHPELTVNPADFRYPGPLPSDKEISLVMLADCCEAASRTLEKPTPETLAQLVNDIFRGKIRNGQLDHSELTMHELTVIRNCFVNTLKTMFHGRIAYPKDEKKDEDDLFVAAGEKISPS